jgi:hypothetical protein
MLGCELAHQKRRPVGRPRDRQQLEFLAFDARLAGMAPALLATLWEAIDQVSVQI